MQALAQTCYAIAIGGVAAARRQLELVYGPGGRRRLVRLRTDLRPAGRRAATDRRRVRRRTRRPGNDHTRRHDHGDQSRGPQARRRRRRPRRPLNRQTQGVGMADLVGALDQGTTSTRFMVFDHGGNAVGRQQLEHEQILPQAGWVEQSPIEIWERTRSVIQTTMIRLGLAASHLGALGVANQRETTVVWNKKTGRPYYNAIVWQDTRTAPIAT